jgi:hypothetical protein
MSHALRVHTMSALVCCAVAASACSSDMPTGPSPQSLAEHFDSVLTQHPRANNAWSNALTLAISALSLGVAPTTVQISINGTATTFQAVAFDEIAPGFGVDSTIHIAAWTGGSNPASVMRIDEEFSGIQTFPYVEYAPDTAQGSVGGGGTVTASLAMLSGKCHPESGTDTSLVSNCQLGTIIAGFDVPSIQTDIVHLVMTSRALHGMRI